MLNRDNYGCPSKRRIEKELYINEALPLTSSRAISLCRSTASPSSAPINPIQPQLLAAVYRPLNGWLVVRSESLFTSRMPGSRRIGRNNRPALSRYVHHKPVEQHSKSLGSVIGDRQR